MLIKQPFKTHTQPHSIGNPFVNYPMPNEKGK